MGGDNRGSMNYDILDKRGLKGIREGIRERIRDEIIISNININQ
jgi:hypothetical protein